MKKFISEKGNEFLEYIKQTGLTGIKETNGNLVVEIRYLFELCEWFIQNRT